MIVPVKITLPTRWLSPPGRRDGIGQLFFGQASSRVQLTGLARLVGQGHLHPRLARYARLRKQPGRSATH
jgi:hypothetical protein